MLGHWVDLLAGDDYRGGGLALNSQYVLTAEHCLNDVDSLVVQFYRPDGTRALKAIASVAERHCKLDLALLRLGGTLDESVTVAEHVRCRPREAWRSRCRPALSKAEVNGDVQIPSLLFENQRGGIVEAVQLGSLLGLATYRGYSGGPAELQRENPPAEVAGLIVAELLRRPGAEAASDVLFAVRIGFALSCLGRFSARTLLEKLTAEPVLAAASPEEAPAQHLNVVAGFAARQRVWPPLLRVKRLRSGEDQRQSPS